VTGTSGDTPPGPAAGGQEHTRPAGRLARFVPALAWAPAYKPADMIRRSAVDGQPGPDRIFPNLDTAVAWAGTSDRESPG
jgi:hypothetical protein